MTLPIAGCSASAAPTSRPPDDDGQQAFGQLLVDDGDQGEHAERGVFGRLDHDGVAHPQGRGDLPDGDHHGPVPRADRADDADGPVVQLGVGFAVVHHDFGVQRGGGGGAQPSCARADLESRVRAVQRLALLTGEELGEFFGVSVRRRRRPCSSASLRRRGPARPTPAVLPRRRRPRLRGPRRVWTGAWPTASPVAGSRIGRVGPSAGLISASRAV